MGKIPSCFIKNLCEISAKLIAFGQNLPRKFPRNGLFSKLANFAANLSLRIPQNFDFFSVTYRGPVLWTVYVIKVLDLVTFFSLSPPFFPPSGISNLDLSYLKSEGLNYIRSIKERTNCLVIQSLFLTGHCPLTSRYLKP